MFINPKRREVNVKIVYYGPPLSGKTTNLIYVHSKTNPEIRGDLISLKTREDRTIYFDFLQLELGEIEGLKPRFNLYTVPGQVRYLASRKLVLRGADGVVFVADSQAKMRRSNIAAMRNLEQNLREFGVDPSRLPLVLQLNKRDLPDVVPEALLQADLGHSGAVCFSSVATEGVGVLDTLKAIIKLVMAGTHRQLPKNT
ncbi:MAG: gliding-motility protein MglA [Anaerolineae bacterium]|nr:gliding-motility protein MglA [Anaerolineae bacterium]NIN95766.1 gliding-motility protein MglA [Anaerolineae bacterium]NIQ78741.1 gliding-motility protein MglA [Anaerolineae bacterium]